ncbi:MAG TPA: hypothetical protein VNB22_19940 [Pyrinomonadaceae bacterium]|jgi:hypothetical protein|nr:hypothetical protein [Pyrinomonadaceae bacterium]
MQSAPKLFIALLIAAIFTGCASNNAPNTNAANQSANSANSNGAASIKDDADELEMMIKLPFHPEEAIWREEVLGKTGDNRVPAPTDKKLTAVLRFLKEDADKITAQAEKYKPAATEIINSESWFPTELVAQSQTSGDETLKGKSYAANDFYNPPYTDGKLTRIDGTDYFVLELFAK